ncbi:AI-2E family transporter, partial [Patescibacteria group bacterium]
YVVLKVIGVDFPEFWAFIIFLFNYIPVVGSLVAVSFPIMLSLVQFPGLLVGLIVTVCLFSIQFIVSNFVEPPLIGNSLNLSPVVIVLSLALWGSIWGIIGMILCVPITVIVNIVFSKFPNTRPVAILLSSNGTIDNEKK